MTEDQDREAFEKAVTVEGMHVNLTRIGPADSHAGEYAHAIVQTCWQVWQYALAYSQEKQNAPEPEPSHQHATNKENQHFWDIQEKNGLLNLLDPDKHIHAYVKWDGEIHVWYYDDNETGFDHDTGLEDHTN